MTLDKAPRNIPVAIASIEGGWNLRQRLNQIGIHIGDTIFIVRGGALGGPILISMNHSNIAIGRGMAKKIMVTVVRDDFTSE